MENGASEGTRTLMRKAQDPKSCASTNSATLAYFLIIVCNGNRVKKRPVKTFPAKTEKASCKKDYFVSSRTAVQCGQRVASSAMGSLQN